MPKISVIVPVYNTELYLKECIDSILSQSFDDFELIAIDDGSTDKSRDILEEYKASDPRVTILDGGHNGAPRARNLGFDHATGEFCFFFDSDDYMLPRALERLISASDDENMVIGNFIVTSGNDVKFKRTIGRAGCLHTNNKDDLYNLMDGWQNPVNKLIRREWLIENGINWFDSAVAQDLNYYQKILSVIDRVIVIPDDVAVYRYSPPGGISSQRNSKILSAILSLDEVEHFATEHNASHFFFEYFKKVRLQCYCVQIRKCKEMSLKDAHKIGRVFYSESKKISDDQIDNRSIELKCNIKWAYSRYCSLVRLIYMPYFKLKYKN